MMDLDQWADFIFQGLNPPVPREPENTREIIAQDQGGMRSNLRQMEERLDRMALVTRALFELLSEKAGVTERDLARKIAEVDERDGVRDGRMTARAKPCPSCGSMMSPKFNRCLFCGHRDPAADPFNPVK